MRGVLLAAVFVGVTTTAAAQDLVVNGQYNNDISSWVLQGFGSQAWSDLDWEGNPASGSIQLQNTRSAPNQVTTSAQCILLDPTGTYEFGAHVRFASGQSSTGFGSAGVAWFDNPNCVGPALLVSSTPLVSSSNTDTWVESFLGGFTAPLGTESVGVGTVVIKSEAGGLLEANFDRVHFGPTGTTPVTALTFSVE